MHTLGTARCTAVCTLLRRLPAHGDLGVGGGVEEVHHDEQNRKVLVPHAKSSAQTRKVLLATHAKLSPKEVQGRGQDRKVLTTCAKFSTRQVQGGGGAACVSDYTRHEGTATLQSHTQVPGRGGY
eukprot:291813-Rhodomonas_salina.1